MIAPESVAVAHRPPGVITDKSVFWRNFKFITLLVFRENLIAYISTLHHFKLRFHALPFYWGDSIRPHEFDFRWVGDRTSAGCQDQSAGPNLRDLISEVEVHLNEPHFATGLLKMSSLRTDECRDLWVVQ